MFKNKLLKPYYNYNYNKYNNLLTIDNQNW